MPRAKKSKQYTLIENRTIYLLKSPLTKEFYIGHTLTRNLRSTYKDHYIEAKYKTKNMIAGLKKDNLRPCYFMLEQLDCTAVQAYKHVIVWTKIMFELGYILLDKGEICNYIQELQPKNFLIYEEQKEKFNEKILCCDTCLVPTYGRKKCAMKLEVNNEQCESRDKY